MATKQFDIAKREKNDEFYTQFEDIEKELIYYKKQFKDKVIYCNCDNPHESNFLKYFIENFNDLGIKKLIATNYKSQYIPVAYKAEIVEVKNTDKVFENPKNKLTTLKGDGDFRSDECIELLKVADIVVTNPPFFFFLEYVDQLMEYKKKFLFIGNMNSLIYKEIFPLIKENKIWIGFNSPNDFIRPNGTITKNVAGLTRWFTNLEVSKRHENLTLYKKYNPEEYPKYDNYDAIEVSKVAEIPYDYEGAMGVPITFIDKYNPEQFEIIKFRKGNDNKDLSVNGKCPYFRIIIRRIGGAY